MDTIVIIGATITSVTLSFTGVGLLGVPISAGVACALSIANKVLHKLIVNKFNEYIKHYQKDNETIKSFDKFYRKSLQDNLFDKNEYESLCTSCTIYLYETKNESFL